MWQTDPVNLASRPQVKHAPVTMYDERLDPRAMAINDLLNGQPFTLAGAVTGGVSRDRVRSLIRNGEVRAVLHGVYVAASAPDDVGLRARAAQLVMPEHGVVCDRCAAWLHGIDILELAELDVTPALDVVSIGGKDGSHRTGVFGGKRDLRPEDVMTLDGIAVTTPIRTACDIACLRGRYRALATLDAFRRSFGISQEELGRMFPRYAGRRGCKQLRELVGLSTDQADSQLESWVRLMIHDDGIPMPAPQEWVLVPDWGWCRVENAYAHLRIAVEYDGEAFHSAAEDREHDRLRREALARLGWRIIVVRKDDLSATARTGWLRELRSDMALRTPPALDKRIYSRGPDAPSYRRTR